MVQHRGGAVGQQARGIDIHRHIHQLVLDRLEFRDRPAELLAQFGVLQRRVVSALRHADGKRGDRDAAAIQNPQAVDEAFVQLAEQSALAGKPAVLENHFAGGAGAQAQLVFLLAGAETGRVLLEDERRNAVLRGGAIGHRHGDADVGVVGVGGERLGRR